MLMLTAIEHETFWTLLRDLSHWEFELFLMALFDGFIGVLIWPYIKKAIKHRQNCDCDTEEQKKLRELIRAEVMEQLTKKY